MVRVEWEQAAWINAGNPQVEMAAKRNLLRWRLHALLADLTGDLLHYHEAALARPDLPVTRAVLGCALARVGRLPEAVPHLRCAVESNPFDRPAVRALYQTLSDTGDLAGARRLARDRLLLHRSAPDIIPDEPWFREAPPAGDELASIILPCYNQLSFTRQCLESLLRHTRPPYQLILVDNASNDGTPAYLEKVRTTQEPARVVILRNETNVGFPAACNQGIAKAQGRFIVFLNNDTVVTEGWLERLIACVLHDYPRIGLVGPVTNASRPPQEIPVDYTDLADLPAFAERRHRAFAGQAQGVERLTGFCLLARREVLAVVGGFDEGYGIGFFDDDDLSVRVRKAGFTLAVALDVFIHHAGSRTFTALGVDCQKRLQENFARFQAKWGPKEAAGYHLPGTEHLPVLKGSTLGDSRTGRPRVSLCLIVKNEEHNLPACLASAADLVDEVIVVDTGSTDRTRELALQAGARVFDFLWCDSFAAARNESIRRATGDWIFWLDADDRLDEANRQKLRALFASLPDENAAFVMTCLCLPDRNSDIFTEVTHVRLFRNRPDLRWEHRVHEQILPAVRRSGGEVRFCDVVIQHTGYTEASLRRKKLERDLRLLLLEDIDRPDHPFTLFNLGSVQQELGRASEALFYFRRSLALSHPADSIVRKLYALIGQCHRNLGQPQEALGACLEGRGHYPDDAELLFLEALLHQETGDARGAIETLVRLIEGGEKEHFASVASGLRGYKARHQLALLYRDLGHIKEAEVQWQAALAERPDFVPGWIGLGELFLAQGRLTELDEVLCRLGTLPQGGEVAAALRARGQRPGG